MKTILIAGLVMSRGGSVHACRAGAFFIGLIRRPKRVRRKLARACADALCAATSMARSLRRLPRCR